MLGSNGQGSVQRTMTILATQRWNRAGRVLTRTVLAATCALGLSACALLRNWEQNAHQQLRKEKWGWKDDSTAISAGPVGPSSEFASYPRRPGEVIRLAQIAPLDASPRSVEGSSTDVGKTEVPAANSGKEPAPLPLWPTSSVASLPDPPLLAAVRAHIEGKPERALEALAMLDADNQDFVLALLPILSSGAALRWREDGAAAAELVGQLQSLAERMEPHAALQLGTVAFCHPVHGYRRYEPWPANTPYRPGDLAQLYIEVRNISGQPGQGPRGESWLIQAQASIVIRDARGQPVAMPDPTDRRRRVSVMRFEEKRYTRGPVRDYYLLCAFPVPEHPGVYTAVVEVTDVRGRRSPSSPPIEFRVAGPIAAAAPAGR